MRIPYRTRRVLGRLAVTLVVIAAFLALVLLCWALWLGRFVVYTGDGAKLDFEHSSADMTGVPALPPEEETLISIHYNDGEELKGQSTELTQLNGYYVTADALKADIPQLRTQLTALPAGTAVMVDVKNIYGEFFYSSTVSTARSGSIDPEQMDALIDHLAKSNLYAIARVPAFQDYTYGLNHVDDGLFSTQGAFLWRDDAGCYWLNPAREGTISYLVQIVTELKQLGFDEVVFDAFWFPDSDGYTFPQDRYQKLTTAAATLATTCATDRFAVSFIGDSSFPMPQGRGRLYMRNVEAAATTGIAEQAQVPDPVVNLVFLTEVHDTRFDVYSVLRPISAIR